MPALPAWTLAGHPAAPQHGGWGGTRLRRVLFLALSFDQDKPGSVVGWEAVGEGSIYHHGGSIISRTPQRPSERESG